MKPTSNHILFFLILALISNCNTINAKELSLSFDDAPRSDGYYFSGNERADTLLHKLKILGISQVAFYVISKNINESTKSRIEKYANSGHLICNHTHQHLFAHRTPASEYIEDIRKCDSAIRNFKNYTKLFRFPYLDHGKPVEKRDSIRSGLSEMGYQMGYITIDNYDWHIEYLFQKALESGKKIDMTKMKQFYLDHIIQSIEFYDNMSMIALNHQSKHILLLHENDLAALFIDELVKELRYRGWEIVSPMVAYNDELLSAQPKTSMQYQGRIAALAKDKGYGGPFFQKTEDEQYLENLFNTSGIIAE